MFTLKAETDIEYVADLSQDDEGIWTATVWVLTEDGVNLLARFVDVECPAVGDPQ